MRRSWSRIKLVALVMLLTVLMHDAVMAGDAHAPSHDSHRSHHTTGDFGDGHSVGESDRVATVASAYDAFRVAHGASPCGLTVAARSGLDADLLPEPADAGVAPPSTTDHRPLAIPAWAGNPGPIPPPNVRRALLQVFLN